MESEVLTVPEAASYLRVSNSQLYTMVRRGMIPHARLSPSPKGRIRIRKSALEEFMHGGTRTPETQSSPAPADVVGYWGPVSVKRKGRR